MFAWLADVPAVGVSDGRSQTEFQVADPLKNEGPPTIRALKWHVFNFLVQCGCAAYLGYRGIWWATGDGGPSPADQGRIGPSGLPPDPTLLAAYFAKPSLGGI
jgi:hypothetical protein